MLNRLEEVENAEREVRAGKMRMEGIEARGVKTEREMSYTSELNREVYGKVRWVTHQTVGEPSCRSDEIYLVCTIDIKLNSLLVLPTVA
jgi:hypothetical protein